MESVVFITEPLLSEEFVQYSFVAPLAEWLSKSFDVTVASPAIAPEVQRSLSARGIGSVSGRSWFPPLRHRRDEIPSYVWSWMRDATLRLNGREFDRLLEGFPGLRVNLTMTTACRNDVWYIQGRPLGPTLKSLAPSLRPSLRLAMAYLGPPVAFLDEHHVAEAARSTRWIYTHSAFLRDWFHARGFPVSGLVPSYLYPFDFSPTTANPSRDYILTYLAKETDVAAIHELARLGIPIKAFGGKSNGWTDGARLDGADGHVEHLGRVSHEHLRELYSNAMFTAFPFTEEPFGLVPIESMACGTPVLTYARQGPGETVLNGQTGWLVRTVEELVREARRVTDQGVPADWREACIRQARNYQLDVAGARWTRILRQHLDDRASGSPRRPEIPRRAIPTTQRRGSPDSASR